MDSFDIYPEKPLLKRVKRKSRLDITVFTMVLFVASFLFFFQDSLGLILGLLLVLFIHELGHFAFMKKFKYRNVRMLFVPLMGAFVQGSKDKYSQIEAFFVVLAGPIPGIVLGSILFYLGSLYQEPYSLTLSFIFILLNAINLLPLDPLDGGQVLNLLVGKKQNLFQLLFSLLSSLILIGIGLYLEAPLLTIFGLLMSFRVRNIQKKYNLHKQMSAAGINFQNTYADISNKEYAAIRGLVLDNNRALAKYMDVNPNTEEAEEVMALQVDAALEAPIALDASWWMKSIVILLWLGGLILPTVYIWSNIVNLKWYYEILQSWG